MTNVFALHVPFTVQQSTDDSIVDMKYGCLLFTFNGIIMPVVYVLDVGLQIQHTNNSTEYL